MKSRKLFRYIWNFNAIVIAIGAVLAIGIMLLVSYEIFSEITRTRNARNVVNIAQDESGDVVVKYRLGSGSYSAENQTIRYPLTMLQEFDLNFSSGKSTENTVNYLLFDIETGESRWVFDGHDQLILSRTNLYENIPEDNEPVFAHLYTLVTRDTNNDDRLSDNDAKSLAIARLDGSQLTELLTGVADTTMIISKGESLVLLSYRDTEGLLYVAEIDLDGFQVKSNTPVDAILPN